MTTESDAVGDATGLVCVKCGDNEGVYPSGMCKSPRCHCHCEFPVKVEGGDQNNSVEAEKAPCYSQTAIPQDNSLKADQHIVPPLIAQLLTTWTAMMLDYNGTVNRMKDASRPHDAARYEAKMETLAWCSKELTAVAKRLPITQAGSGLPALNTKLLNEKMEAAGFDAQEQHVIQILISQCLVKSQATSATGDEKEKSDDFNVGAYIDQD